MLEFWPLMTTRLSPSFQIDETFNFPNERFQVGSGKTHLWRRDTMVFDVRWNVLVVRRANDDTRFFHEQPTGFPDQNAIRLPLVREMPLVVRKSLWNDALMGTPLSASIRTTHKPYLRSKTKISSSTA